MSTVENPRPFTAAGGGDVPELDKNLRRDMQRLASPCNSITARPRPRAVLRRVRQPHQHVRVEQVGRHSYISSLPSASLHRHAAVLGQSEQPPLPLVAPLHRGRRKTLPEASRPEPPHASHACSLRPANSGSMHHRTPEIRRLFPFYRITGNLTSETPHWPWILAMALPA